MIRTGCALEGARTWDEDDYAKVRAMARARRSDGSPRWTPEAIARYMGMDLAACEAIIAGMINERSGYGQNRLDYYGGKEALGGYVGTEERERERDAQLGSAALLAKLQAMAGRVPA